MPSYVNLANLYFGKDEIDSAIHILQQAHTMKPRSALVNLLLAQYFYRQGNSAKTTEHYSTLEEISARLASRYSYLKQTTGTKARAAAADGELSLIWDVDDEE